MNGSLLTDGGAIAARAAAVLVAPVAVVVITFAILAVLSMFVGPDRRSHAVQVMECLIRLAHVVRPLRIRQAAPPSAPPGAHRRRHRRA